MYDAIVVGGGHNGLVAAAYLARAGLQHRGARGPRQRRRGGHDRDAVGTRVQDDGAVLRDEPDAADDPQRPRARPSTATTSSRWGRRTSPSPTAASSCADDDPSRDRRRGRQVLQQATPTALGDYDAWLDGVADVLAPLLLRTPPSVGLAPAQATCIEQLRLAWGLRGLDVRGTADATRLFTMRIRDLLDEWFESPEVKGVHGDQRRHRHLGRPRRAGHRLRDDAPHDRRRRRRPPRHVGLPDRRHGRGLRRHPRARPSRSAPRSAPTRRSSASSSRTARSSAWRSPTARSCERRHRRRRHPPADHVPPPARPQRAARRLRRTTSSTGAPARGTVKVNVALSELPDFDAWPGTDRTRRSYTGVGRAVPLDRLPRAGLPGRPRGHGRRPARSPTACIPSTVDPTLCPEGTHVMSLFTQWVPARRGRRAAPRRAGGLRRPGDRRLQRAGPELQGSRSSTARSSGPTRWSTSTA